MFAILSIVFVCFDRSLSSLHIWFVHSLFSFQRSNCVARSHMTTSIWYHLRNQFVNNFFKNVINELAWKFILSSTTLDTFAVVHLICQRITILPVSELFGKSFFDWINYAVRFFCRIEREKTKPMAFSVANMQNMGLLIPISMCGHKQDSVFFIRRHDKETYGYSIF